MDDHLVGLELTTSRSETLVVETRDVHPQTQKPLQKALTVSLFGTLTFPARNCQGVTCAPVELKSESTIDIALAP